mgnify:CR=1 FL=1
MVVTKRPQEILSGAEASKQAGRQTLCFAIYANKETKSRAKIKSLCLVYFNGKEYSKNKVTLSKNWEQKPRKLGVPFHPVKLELVK